VVRYGRLAAADVARRGVAPMPVVGALRVGAQTILPGDGPLRGAPAEETRLIYRWLTGGGTRLVHCDPPWGEPARGAAGWGAWARRAREGTDAGRTAVAEVSPSERLLPRTEPVPSTTRPWLH
jgi:DNA polymerase-3 subunit epsilon